MPVMNDANTNADFSVPRKFDIINPTLGKTDIIQVGINFFQYAAIYNSV